MTYVSPTPAPPDTYPSQDLVSLADLKAFLRIPSATTTYDTMLGYALDDVSEQIETRVGPVVPTTYWQRFDGWGGETIQLGHRPVISVNYVNEYHSTGGLLVLNESTPQNALDGYQLEWQTGRFIRVFQGGWPRTWFPGSRNVEISYTAGYGSPREITDGATTINTTTLTSPAQAQFVAADVGRFVAGPGIPGNTTIASVTNATTAVMSAQATATASGLTVNIIQATVPPPIRMAALQWAAHTWQQGQEATAGASQLGAAMRGFEAVETTGEWCGVPREVKAKLAPYRVPVIGMA